MNYTKNLDGRIQVTFEAKELPILVKLVKADVEFEAKKLRKEAKDSLSSVVKAEKELESDEPQHE